jgi:hypothetical protein
MRRGFASIDAAGAATKSSAARQSSDKKIFRRGIAGTSRRPRFRALATRGDP